MNKNNMYTIDSIDNYYVVKKNNIPISLSGIGILRFDEKEDAERYIRLIRESQYQIRMGVPE
jgi:hypothetical protein